MVGIKGTGMAALAELLLQLGAKVEGSDTTEKFYTDEILLSLGIPYSEGFNEQNLIPRAKLVIHSAAYNPDENPELKEALSRGIPIISYPEALGHLSKLFDSSGISGVHGKTTTAAFAATICTKLDLPASVLVGSAVTGLKNRCTTVRGDKYFIAETCEYRRHFLFFKPKRIIITNVEYDHPDYFTGFENTLDTFTSYAETLPKGGEIIYCEDDRGASLVAERITEQRPDIGLIPYGEKAGGEYRVREISVEPGRTRFSLDGFKGEFSLRIPGKHTAFNAVAAMALVCSLLKKEKGEITENDLQAILAGIDEFRGSKRRSEIIGEAGGVLFMDDYAHHPTAIRKTIEGLKEFYPHKRIVVDFMSHTYSRTCTLLEDFGKSLQSADEVILHKIYASAREQNRKSISGWDLYTATRKYMVNVSYYHEVMDALDYCLESLNSPDLFITMGAGDNWRLGYELHHRMLEKEKGRR